MNQQDGSSDIGADLHQRPVYDGACTSAARSAGPLFDEQAPEVLGDPRLEHSNGQILGHDRGERGCEAAQFWLGSYGRERYN
jgi:hypothetical protein